MIKKLRENNNGELKIKKVYKNVISKMLDFFQFSR